MSHSSTRMPGPSPRHGPRLVRGVIATLACVATTGVTLVAAGAPAGAATDPAGAPRPTGIGLQATAFGTEVLPGSLHTGSARTALLVLGCTTAAGVDRHKSVGTDDLTELGSASGVRTRVWTTENAAGVVSTYSRSTIAKVRIADAGVASLKLDGVSVTARTWHDSSGFHRSNSFSLVGLSARVLGVPFDLPAPGDIDPGQSIEIPGLLIMTFDKRTGSVGPQSAAATSTGVLLELADGTRASLARAESRMDADVKGGLLSGQAVAADSDDEVVALNRVVKRNIPCNGTDGRWLTSDGAATDLLPGLTVGAATVGALGDQISVRQAVAKTRARTARIELGGADGLVVTAIRTQASVVRDGDQYARSAAGSSIGSISIDGTEQELPDPGEVLVVPGVAEITTQVVTKTAQSITVVGLRIDLLDSTEVIDIARSTAQIKAR